MGDDGQARAVRAAAAGHAGRFRPDDAAGLAALVASDPDSRVRGAALGALVRAAPRAVAAAAWSTAAGDGDASVRRRAAELAPALGRRVAVRALLGLLADPDASVAEAAAFALGERPSAGVQAVTALSAAAAEHDDPLVRESAVAALGSIGDARGLAAILRACADRPAVRRRAVLALAPFDGPDVDAALQRALEDPDWQVRQAAEDLLAP